MTLYENTELQKKYGKAAQQQIDMNFNNSRTVQEVKALYNQLASDLKP